jgi:hypothetical protein
MFKAITFAVILASAGMIATPVSAKKAGSVIDQEVSVRKDGALSIERLEPGLTLAIRGDLSVTQAFDIAVVNLPATIPPEWTLALATDHARSIPITDEEGKPQVLPLQPVVFRALYARATGEAVVYTAIVNQDGTSFFVLLPPGSQALMGGHLYIISNDGRYALTAGGVSVSLKDSGVKLSKGRLSTDFFEKFPSPISEIGTLSRMDVFGGKFFADLDMLYPERFQVRGVTYSGRPYAQKFLALYTPLNSFGDRYVSCGSLAVGSGGLIGLATSVVFSMPKALSHNDCLASKPRTTKGK